MSWSGFKKNVGRATTQVMMKTGHVEKTSDREYEVEERRYRTLESASLRLQKEAKGYLDSLRAMTASQMRIAETIDAFYGDSGASDGVSRSYKQAVEDLDAETVKALDGPYRSVPSDLRGYAWDDERGVEDAEELRKIEWEMNYGRRKTCTGARRVEIDEYGELMDFIYRTTVLEPINRFCAYFPDINE
ncbi:BAR adaptor protein Hob3, partial [Oleoguttula sp. CCFEE 5521]